ncbi:MAG: alpha/beta hydrolase [Candidatus Eremiobacteraeota bacterium]|nr:alpha/beta hydrolase [Candidatus Eremiobacteraeota bacterium]
MRRNITFASEGLQLAGWLYVPEDLPAGERRPAIVMAHGFSATKEMCLPNFAERFCAAGFVVTVFDYRFQGESEGEPRGQIFPQQQHDDYRNAISWTQLQPEVDPERIGVWGSSYSGAHVMHLAAFDKRIKAVVAQMMLVDGWANALRLNRPDHVKGLHAMLAADRLQRYQGGAVNYVPVVAAEGEPSALPTPDSLEWFTRVSGEMAPTWRNQVTLESMEHFLYYYPTAHIELISPTPLLMIVASDDVLTPTDLAIAAYERALQPKSLVIVKGGHFDGYMGPALEQTAPPAVAWFEKHLM